MLIDLHHKKLEILLKLDQADKAFLFDTNNMV